MPIPAEVRDLLDSHSYGISFPCYSGCQMRFIQNGEDLGRFYSYRQWGGVRKAVRAAIDRNLQLRVAHRRKAKTGKQIYRRASVSHSNTGVVGVSGSRYLDARRGTWHWRYLVRWVDAKGEPHIKSFNLVEPYTSDQQLHALRSAVQFRKTWEEDVDIFDPTPFKLWRQKRLYDQGKPELPSGFWITGNTHLGGIETRIAG
jgi:hypothetical protein